MKSQPSLEDLTRTNWCLIAVLGAIAVVLLIIAQILAEVTTTAAGGGQASPVIQMR